MLPSRSIPMAPTQKTSHVPRLNARIISGFWRRLAAFLIDSLIVGMTGFLIGLLFFNKLAQLGQWGHVVGFVIAALYFSVLNSELGNGQTPGKRALGIEVVNKSGRHISLFRSFLRYSVLSIPFFLNNASLSLPLDSSLPVLIAGLLVFGLGGATIYLLVFNRRTRQGTHDLVAGTYVVRSSPKGIVNHGDVWRPHFAIIGAWCVAVMAAGPVIGIYTKDNQTFKNLIAIQKEIEATGKVHFASASEGKSWGYLGGKKWEVNYLQIRAILREPPEDYEKAAHEIAKIVLAQYPKIPEKRVISVVLSYGYDIGIASGWRNHIYSYRAGEWQKILHTTTL